MRWASSFGPLQLEIWKLMSSFLARIKWCTLCYSARRFPKAQISDHLIFKLPSISSCWPAAVVLTRKNRSKLLHGHISVWRTRRVGLPSWLDISRRQIKSWMCFSTLWTMINMNRAQVPICAWFICIFVLCYSSVEYIQESLFFLVWLNCFVLIISDKEFLKGVISTLQNIPFSHCAQKSSKQKIGINY